MASFGIDIKTKVVTNEAIKSGSMTPKINIDPKDPQKIKHCIEDSKQQIAQCIKPQGVETFTDPDTGLIGYYEPGTKTKVLIESIDLPLLGNCYKDGEWHGAGGKVIQSYLMTKNIPSSVAAKKKFDVKKALSTFKKSMSSKFNAATGSFATKNIGNNINNWWATNKENLTGGIASQISHVTATIESRCDSINTIWGGSKKNTSTENKQVDENGNITQPLDKASAEVDKQASTADRDKTNTEEAKKTLQKRADELKKLKQQEQQNNPNGGGKMT